MPDNKFCPCDGNKQHSNCCEPFLLHNKTPQTAEQLMRSRYSAYVIGEIDYLINTTHLSTRKNHQRKDIENWSKETNWLGLEIIQSTVSIIEFIAKFEGKNNSIETHHEKSRFVQEDGQWFYLDGEFFN